MTNGLKNKIDSLQWLTARPIAHRGLHMASKGVIENSKSAFFQAVAHNFAIECDVQLTRDGEAVVFHDFNVDRLTDSSGAVSTFTAAQLSKMSISGSKSEDVINTLDDILAEVAGRVPIVIEIKSRFDGDLRLTRRVVEIISTKTMPLVIKSFDPRVVAALRVMAPDTPRGIVAMSQYEYPDYADVPLEEKRAMANLLHYTEMQPDFISWHVKDLPHAAPHLCRAALGLPVMTWTVRTPADLANAGKYADQMVFEGFVPE
jgi:glycerophosphoryl diester phosphodiesterase